MFSLLEIVLRLQWSPQKKRLCLGQRVSNQCVCVCLCVCLCVCVKLHNHRPNHPYVLRIWLHLAQDCFTQKQAQKFCLFFCRKLAQSAQYVDSMTVSLWVGLLHKVTIKKRCIAMKWLFHDRLCFFPSHFTYVNILQPGNGLWEPFQTWYLPSNYVPFRSFGSFNVQVWRQTEWNQRSCVWSCSPISASHHERNDLKQNSMLLLSARNQFKTKRIDRLASYTVTPPQFFGLTLFWSRFERSSFTHSQKWACIKGGKIHKCCLSLLKCCTKNSPWGPLTH